MIDARKIETQLGPNGLGYAYRSTTHGSGVGICTRHRGDGTPRLVFDLQINYCESRQPEAAYYRQLAVEFLFDQHDRQVGRSFQPLPKDVGVLIGQRDWEELGCRPAPSGQPWKDWKKDKFWIPSTSTRWNDAPVYLVPWSVELRWPTLDIASVFAHETGIHSPRVGMWLGDESVYLLNTHLVRAYGTLEFGGTTTCFFPDLVELPA